MATHESDVKSEMDAMAAIETIDDLVTVSGHQQISCSLCGLKCRDRSILKEHMAFIHDDERPFECGECGCAFRLKIQAQKHYLALHTVSRPHKCPFCGKGFKFATQMRLHLPVHSNSKSHKCQFCGRSFTRIGSLHLHINTYHPRPNLLKCNQCTFECTTVDEMKHHRTKAHPVMVKPQTNLLIMKREQVHVTVAPTVAPLKLKLKLDADRH